MQLRARYRWLAASVVMALSACGGSGAPTSPQQTPLPVTAESASFRFHSAPNDSVDTNWQEAYHGWATARLGLQMSRKIDYSKYQTRQDMGDHTGKYNTNGFADPATFEIHTLWPTDNHELVHIYTSLVGRPSDFFNEGIAVALQTDPPAGHFESVFNGVSVHQACQQYLQSGTLVLPLDRVVTTTDFRAISDDVLSYREAGSFMRFVMDTYGTARLLEFFRVSGRDDGLATIQQHFATTVGVSLDTAETAWKTMLTTR